MRNLRLAPALVLSCPRPLHLVLFSFRPPLPFLFELWPRLHVARPLPLQPTHLFFHRCLPQAIPATVDRDPVPTSSTAWAAKSTLAPALAAAECSAPGTVPE